MNKEDFKTSKEKIINSLEEMLLYIEQGTNKNDISEINLIDIDIALSKIKDVYILLNRIKRSTEDTIIKQSTLFNNQEIPEILSDKFKNVPHSVYDKLSTSKSDKSISSKIGNEPIKDIRKVFGINDKISYTKELFNSDSKQFNNFIELIADTKTKRDGLQILEEYKTKLKWKDDNNYFVSLKELILRHLQIKE